MGKVKDLTGQQFGRLTVIEFAGTKNGNAYWKCQCDCGAICTANGVHLRRGYTQSCGCFRREVSSKNTGMNPKHGMSNTKIYWVWANMKNRCYDKSNIGYHMYGGRGIIVFDKWLNDFKSFYDYVSKLEHFNEDGYTFDRIDNNGNYEPGNVRWATVKEQSRNQCKNICVDYNGKQITLAEAAELSGIKYVSLYSRYKRGWRGDKIFTPIER